MLSSDIFWLAIFSTKSEKTLFKQLSRFMPFYLSKREPVPQYHAKFITKVEHLPVYVNLKMSKCNECDKCTIYADGHLSYEITLDVLY